MVCIHLVEEGRTGRDHNLAEQGLKVSGLTKEFGGVAAINDLSFETMQGEVFGIIGPNGSGKTTLFNLITGVTRPTLGIVRYRGELITGLRTDDIARRGLIRTYQAATVFAGITVRENLLRSYIFSRIGKPSTLLLSRSRLMLKRKANETANRLMEFAKLTEVADTLAGALPYGMQKILGVTLALAQGPSQILLDEPAAGLNATETATMGRFIKDVHARMAIDVVLVEHDMKMVAGLCDRIMALNYGRMIAIDIPTKILQHPEVVTAYLGNEHE